VHDQAHALVGPEELLGEISDVAPDELALAAVGLGLPAIVEIGEVLLQARIEVARLHDVRFRGERFHHLGVRLRASTQPRGLHELGDVLGEDSLADVVEHVLVPALESHGGLPRGAELAEPTERERFEQVARRRDELAVHRRVERDDQAERLARVAEVELGPRHLEKDVGIVRSELLELLVVAERILVSLLVECDAREAADDLLALILLDVLDLLELLERLDRRGVVAVGDESDRVDVLRAGPVGARLLDGLEVGLRPVVATAAGEIESLVEVDEAADLVGEMTEVLAREEARDEHVLVVHAGLDDALEPEDRVGQQLDVAPRLGDVRGRASRPPTRGPCPPPIA
jgi:hypothetical protein